MENSAEPNAAPAAPAATLNAAMEQLRSEKTESDNGSENVDSSDKNVTDGEAEHPGREYVKTDDPKVAARINYLYKQVKGSDETNKVLREDALRTQEALERLMAEQESLKAQLAERDSRAALQSLRGQLREAREAGDDDKVDELNFELQSLLTEQKTNEILKKQAKEAPKPKEPVQEQPAYNVPPEEKAAADKYVFEVDKETGEYMRPWLHNDHPMFEDAVKAAARIAKSQIASGEPADIDTIMPLLEKAIAAKSGGSVTAPKKPQHAEVLGGGGNLTASKKSSTVKLTDDQKFIARKLGISEERYAVRLAASKKAGTV